MATRPTRVIHLHIIACFLMQHVLSGAVLLYDIYQAWQVGTYLPEYQLLYINIIPILFAII